MFNNRTVVYMVCSILHDTAKKEINVRKFLNTQDEEKKTKSKAFPFN